jgi:ATP-binding cassette, subfamily G (WHITE), member 2, SNQ2
MRNGLLDYHGNCPKSLRVSPINAGPQIYVQGFGQGSAGFGGTAFQLIVIIFVELFGVSLGQFIASITPSVQVGILFDPFIMVVLTTFCACPFGCLSMALSSVSSFGQAE